MALSLAREGTRFWSLDAEPALEPEEDEAVRVRGCMRSDGAELARQPQLTKRKRKGREADGSA